MKSKAIIPLALGLGIGLIAVKFAVDAIQSARAANQNKQTITVMRTRVDIGAFQEITPDMVEAFETDENPLFPDAERIESHDDLVGRVTSKSIPEHVAVLESMLAPEGTKPGMHGRIPRGFRAVSVRIDEATSVAFQLQPGDWVDVFVVMDVDSPVTGRRDTVSKVILEKVQVAAIGQAQNFQQNKGSGGQVKPAKSVTLLVLEKDVPSLHMAATRGKITLAMRGDNEPDEVVASPPSADGNMSTLADLLKSFSMPTMQEPEVPTQEAIPHSVIVYRGSGWRDQPLTVEQITFHDADSQNILNVRIGPPTEASQIFSSASRGGGAGGAGGRKQQVGG